MALLQCISTNLAPNHPKDSLKKKNLACIQSYCFNGALIKKKNCYANFFLRHNLTGTCYADQVSLELKDISCWCWGQRRTSSHPACQHYSVKTAISSSIFVNCLILI